MMYDLSICITTYNRSKDLIDLLKNIEIQKTQSLLIEINIIDNFSEVNYYNEIYSFVKDKNIRMFRLTKNFGPSYARSFGFSKSSSKTVLFLDDDITFKTPNDLYNLFILYSKNKLNGILTTYIFDIESKQIQSEKTSKKGNLVLNLKESLSFHGAIHIVDKRIITKEIYLCEIFFGFEELYISMKLRSLGLNVYITDLITINHKGRSNYTNRDIIGMKNQVKIKFLFYHKLIHPIIYLFYITRIIRNNLFFRMTKYNYKFNNPKFQKVKRISIIKTIEMVKKFGVKNIL